MEKEKEDNLESCSQKSSGRDIYVLQETKAHNSLNNFALRIKMNWIVFLEPLLLHFTVKEGSPLFCTGEWQQVWSTSRLYCWTAAQTIQILKFGLSISSHCNYTCMCSLKSPPPVTGMA